MRVTDLHGNNELRVGNGAIKRALLSNVRLHAINSRLITNASGSTISTTFRSNFIRQRNVFRREKASLMENKGALRLSMLIAITTPSIIVRRALTYRCVHRLRTDVGTTHRANTSSTIQEGTPCRFQDSCHYARLASTTLHRSCVIATRYAFRVTRAAVTQHVLVLRTLRRPTIFTIRYASCPCYRVCGGLDLRVAVGTLWSFFKGTGMRRSTSGIAVAVYVCMSLPRGQE